MLAPMATPVARTCSTARRLMTGRLPGSPRQTGHVSVFGGASWTSVEQPQNIFDTVRSWTCISTPMTASKRVAARVAIALIVRDGASTAGEPGGGRRSADGSDETFDAYEGFSEILEARRIRGPDVALTRRPERPPRDHGDLLLEQQPLAELLARESGAGDARERVERAARLERGEPDPVESLDQHPSPAVVLADHASD